MSGAATTAEDNDDGNYAVMITDPNDARIDAAALGLRPDISDNDPLEPIFKFAPNCATYKVQRNGGGTNVHLYGTDEHGHSVVVVAKKFRPYLFVGLKQLDAACGDDTALRDARVEQLVEELQVRLFALTAATKQKWSPERSSLRSSLAGDVRQSSTSAALVPGSQNCSPIVYWEIVSGVPVRGSGVGYGYRGKAEVRFLKLYFYSPRLVPQCRALLNGRHASLGLEEQVRRCAARGGMRDDDGAAAAAMPTAAEKKAGGKSTIIQMTMHRFCAEPVEAMEDDEEVERADADDTDDESDNPLAHDEVDRPAEEEEEDEMEVDEHGGENDELLAEDVYADASDDEDVMDEDLMPLNQQEEEEEREAVPRTRQTWYALQGREEAVLKALERRLERRFVRRVEYLVQRELRRAERILDDTSFDVYEADIDFVLRFAIDCGFSYEEWVQIDLRDARVQRAFEHGARGDARRATHQQIELHCDYRALRCRQDDPIQNELPRHVVMSLDCEMETGPNGLFPKPETERMFQCIATVRDDRALPGRAAVPPTGDKNAFWFRSVSFTLEKVNCRSEPRDGCWERHVFCFESEDVLFLALARFVHVLGPTIVTGYNTAGFDLPYMLNRATKLGVGTAFANAWGRSRYASRMYYRPAVFQSTAVGRIEYNDVRAEGVMFLDLFLKLKKDPAIKLRSLSLNAVASHYLEDQKEDVAYSLINEYQKEPNTREKLRLYCEKDALLPLMLFAHMQVVQSMVEMARINGCSMHELLNRGQQIRSKCCIYREAAQFTPPHRVYTRTDAERLAERHETFDGAAVIDPEVGLFEHPVSTLDWNSLYPSIMATFNFCFSTQVADDYDVHADPDLMCDPDPLRNLTHEERERRAAKAIYTVEECKTKEPFTEGPWVASAERKAAPRFLRHHIKVGLAVYIIRRLLARRSAVKKQQRAAGDAAIAAKEAGDHAGYARNKALEALLEERQLQIKLLGNSIYGVFGAPTSFAYCQAVSAAVTCRGRALLYKMCWIAKTDFAEHQVRVVYGDTDSIFTYLPLCTSVEEAAVLSVRMAAHITAVMKRDYATDPPEYNILNLEFEKVYRTLLSLAKKRYSGLMYVYQGAGNQLKPTPADLVPKNSGLENKKRDVTLLVKKQIEHVLSVLLDYRFPKKENLRRAREYIWRAMVRPLQQRTISMHLLVLTRQLRVAPEEYERKNPGRALPAHVQLTKKLQKRAGGADKAPRSGDRIPWVIVEGARNENVSSRAEDPVYAFENDKPLDVKYYLEKQVAPAMLRLFAPILQGMYHQRLFAPTEHRVRVGATERERKAIGEKRAAEFLFGSIKDYIDPRGDPSEVIMPATLVLEEAKIAKQLQEKRRGIVPLFSRLTGARINSPRYKMPLGVEQAQPPPDALPEAQALPKKRSMLAFGQTGARCRSCGAYHAGKQRGFICEACVDKNGHAAARAMDDAQKYLIDIEDLRRERVEIANTCYTCMGCPGKPQTITCPNSECSVFWQRRANDRSQRALRERLKTARDTVYSTGSVRRLGIKEMEAEWCDNESDSEE